TNNLAPVFDPAMNQQVTMAANSDHHPDFVRKLREGRNYEFRASVQTRSICGKNDLQHVNSYDGSLGQSVEFVKHHQSAVGALAKGNSENSRKFCTGTLISENLFLTASHCINSNTPKDTYISFNYETAKGSNSLLKQEHVKVTEIVEDG